jgi:hypothetical protein
MFSLFRDFIPIFGRGGSSACGKGGKDYNKAANSIENGLIKLE